MRKAILVLALASFATLASANEVYTGIGTDGVSVGYTQALTPYMGARLEGNYLQFNKQVSSDRIAYDGKAKFTAVGLLYDLHPFASSFRVTVGTVIGDRRMDVTASGGHNSITIHGKTYALGNEAYSGSAKFPAVSPYVGIGFGHQAIARGLSFYSDIGVIYGHPSVTLSATPGLVAAAGQANIDAERQSLQNKVDNYRFYPVIKLGIGYVF